ncbi:hypothetical protein E3E23_00830 [Thermococcus sp. CX2]|uniref:hypothetical protein n=1 Tax=Thermococcus sp. CX2 TaxID=163006 RepID=UPI00143A0E92|nr:hypothetical protein [Thermococcus sp. CX2]NJE84391.1 hypothetical protein [Thermococcus sp. CX2]
MQGLNTQPEDFDSKIQEIIPWARPNPLTEVMDEKEREKLEVIEIVENLADHGELPSEVELLIKKPKKEELMEE